MFARILLAIFVLVGLTGVARASGHGGAPADASFMGYIAYEIQHFGMHWSLTLDAVLAAPTSMEVAAFNMALATDPMCVGLSPLTGFLFGTTQMALLTFFVSLLIAFWVTMLVAQTLARWTMKAVTQPVLNYH